MNKEILQKKSVVYDQERFQVKSVLQYNGPCMVYITDTWITVVNLAFQILEIEGPLESLIVILKPPNFFSHVLLMLTSGSWRRIYCAKTFTVKV